VISQISTTARHVKIFSLMFLDSFEHYPEEPVWIFEGVEATGLRINEFIR
jgi:hypothetical protein